MFLLVDKNNHTEVLVMFITWQTGAHAMRITRRFKTGKVISPVLKPECVLVALVAMNARLPVAMGKICSAEAKFVKRSRTS